MFFSILQLKVRNIISNAQNKFINFRDYINSYIDFLNIKTIELTPTEINDREQSNLAARHFLRQCNNILNTVTTKLNIFNISGEYFLNVIWILTIILFILFILFTCICMLVSFAHTLNLFKFFNRLLYVIENEFSGAWTIIILFIVMTFTLLLGWIMPLFNLNIPALFTGVLLAIIIIVILVILIPTSLLFSWGFYSPIYVKGQSIKKNLIIEVLTDYIHFISFFLRINIQLIRLVILSAVFYMYNEMYYEFIYPQYNFNSLLYTPVYFSDYVYIGLESIYIITFNVIYEIGHFWILLLMQSNAFGVIVFIITQFLYTVYLLNHIQMFFLNKRKVI